MWRAVTGRVDPVMWPYTGTMDPMDTELTSREYELLTQHLMRLIAARSPLMTTRLEHDVSLTGRSAANQIDAVSYTHLTLPTIYSV